MANSWAATVGAVGVVLSLTAAGCSKSDSSKKSDDTTKNPPANVDASTTSKTKPNVAINTKPDPAISAEVAKLVDAVCACKDAKCLTDATTNVGKYMRVKLQTVPRKQQRAWMMGFQKRHAAQFARGDDCRKKIKGVNGTTPVDVNVVRAQMKKLGNEMCACKDVGCARVVNKKLSTWALRYFADKKKPDKSVTEKLKPEQKRYGDCFKKLFAAAAKKKGPAPGSSKPPGAPKPKTP